MCYLRSIAFNLVMYHPLRGWPGVMNQPLKGGIDKYLQIAYIMAEG